MSDAKKPERLAKVEMVATERGFYAGRLVEVGKSFLFDPNPRENSKTGKPVRAPKWAVEVGKSVPAPQAPKMGFDTKPADAQAAVRKKAGQLAGDSLA